MGKQDPMQASLDEALRSLEVLAKAEDEDEDEKEKPESEEEPEAEEEEEGAPESEKKDEEEEGGEESAVATRMRNLAKKGALSEKSFSDDPEVTEYMDASPIMKAIKDNILAMREVLTIQNVVLKALVEAAGEGLDLNKSINDAVSVLSSIPRPRKAVMHTGEVMTKNFEGVAEPKGASVSPAKVRTELVKAFEAGEVDMTTLTKAELGRWSPEYCPEAILERIGKE